MDLHIKKIHFIKPLSCAMLMYSNKMINKNKQKEFYKKVLSNYLMELTKDISN